MSASFTLLIYHVQYDKTAAVFFYTLAMGFMGAFYTGVQANFLDLCPNYSGALMGLVSGTGGVCGFLAPYLTAQLTTKVHTTNSKPKVHIYPAYLLYNRENIGNGEQYFGHRSLSF